MRRRPSIRTYLILMNLLLLCLLFPSISFLTMRATANFRDEQLARTIEVLEEALIDRGTALARNLSLNSSQAVAGYDFSSVLKLLQQATENDPDMKHSFIMAKDGQVLADHEQKEIGKVLNRERDKKALEITNQNFPEQHQPGSTPPVFVLRDVKGMDPSLIEILTPVYNGEQVWGMLRCIFSRQSLEQEISLTRQKWTQRMQSFSIYLFSMAALFLILGIAVVIYFTRPILNALLSLGGGVEQISNGDLQHTISEKNLACREFEDLAASFNNMTSFLRASREQLAEYSRGLEDKVEARTLELNQAHESLLKQAHEAGMAEMAVGVLHNIGNAITPAKVGTSMLLKRLQESPLRHGLAPALMPLAEIIAKASDLAEPERQRLRAITELLPRSIQEEYSQLIEEISRIREKHDHIEAIISLQMRYARLLGKAEPVDINRVVRDALDMLSDSINKRHIEVDLQLAEVPQVRLEKAKLIQVIVNIIKNSYEAIDQNGGKEKKITIISSLAHTAKPAVLLLVKDTGCGFLASDDKRLFTFGYSSKNRGTGFGLHSCANYVIANHGTITATSEGAGRGAVFTLTLPITPINTEQDKEQDGL